MTPKVKVFFVFLALMAIFSVFSFFDVLGGVRSANIIDAAKPLPLTIEDDFDQDGLSNDDEAYWNTDFQNKDTDGDGFLDGEEVASGRDPREPADHPLGDKLTDTVYGAPEDVTPDFNITTNLSEMIVNGIQAQDLKPGVDNTKFAKGVDAVSLSVVDNFYKSQTPPAQSFNITDNSKENQVIYLNALAQIVKKDLLEFPQKANLSIGITDQLPFFEAKSNQYRVSYDKISALSVPQEWLDTQKSILDLLYLLYLNYHTIAGYNSDMIKATLAMAELSNLNVEIPSLLQSIKAKVTENNLTLDDSLYQIMDLLYKQ